MHATPSLAFTATTPRSFKSCAALAGRNSRSRATYCGAPVELDFVLYRKSRGPANGLALGTLAFAFYAGAVGRLRRGRSSRVAVAVLPDGTNEEGEELPMPLDFARGDLKDVVLYGQEMSPPCVKIRTLLNYYSVPFKEVKGRHPTSDYKKIPVLEMNGRQINDSHIILKNLAPLLSGEPLTPEQSAWERTITFEFQPAIEVELFGDGADIARFASLDGWKRTLAEFLAPLLGAVVGQLFKSRYPGYELPSSRYGVEFRKALAGRPFFHGEAPGPVDLSLYGTYASLSKTGCNTSAKFLEESGLNEWHQRMVEAVDGVVKA